MYTGVDLFNSIRFRTNQGQAGAFLNIDRANELIRSGRVKILEDDWRKIVTQASKDEISPMIKLAKPFTPNNNKILLKPLIITNVSIGTNCIITFDRPHNLVANTPIVISDVLGVTSSNVNGAKTTYTTPSTTTISLTGVTSTGVYTSGTGKAISSGYIVDDYYHLLSISHTYSESYNDVKVLSVINNTKLFEITITYNNNFRRKQKISGTGFLGLTTTSFTDLYVQQVSENKIRLFTDEGLTIPYTVGGKWTGGGIISASDTTYADPSNSDQNIDNYNSTAYFPLYKLGENSVSIETYIPYTNTLTTNITEKVFTLDYISELPSIDLENSTYDIYQIHNANFYDRLIEYCALKFQAQTSSPEDIQNTEIIGGFKE